MKFTFKKETLGTWNVLHATYIKYNKIEVGMIQEQDSKSWKIKLMTNASEDALARNPNCPWMWIRVKIDFKTEDDARLWINQHVAEILPIIYFEGE